MPASGQRHRLILYAYILDRFWGRIFGIGIVLLALVAAITWLPSIFPQYTPPQVASWILRLTGGVGASAIFLAIFLVIASRSAYVQPFDTHLRLVTPFLRMKFSYQLFILASSAGMGRLFSLEDLKGQKRAFFRPFANQTAIVLELTEWPLPRRVMELFLSPYFFPDRTSRLALIVPDWISFSNELESFRSTWLDSVHHPANNPHSDLLASLSGKR